MASQAPQQEEETAHPAGELRRRSMVAFGVGVAALSGLAVAAVVGGIESPSGFESFPISTCCLDPMIIG